MAENKKNKEDRVVVAEFKVSMHCNGCERSLAKTISKIKGVEKFTTDMKKHKVVITGRIDPQKVLRKLKKKTGKRVEIVIGKEDPKDVAKAEDVPAFGGVDNQVMGSLLIHSLEDCPVYTMFSDENANSCSIM